MICIYVYVRTCMCVYIYGYKCVCTSIYIYIYVCVTIFIEKTYASYQFIACARLRRISIMELEKNVASSSYVHCL